MFVIATVMTAFHELDEMCARDNGHMWGVSVCGPTVFVDPQTRHFVARRNGEITEGTMPQSIGMANTAIDWQGDRWAMVMLPLPEQAYTRRVLLAHALDPLPELLLLDEPASGLDEPAAQLLERLLAALCREDRVTVLMVSHDLAQARRIADRVTVLARSVRADGPAAEILAAGRLVELVGLG